MSKLFSTTLLALTVMLPTIAQSDGTVRSKAQRKPHSLSNRLPVIKSLTTSSSTITIPCPRWVAGAYSVDSLTLDITTKAFDSDGDALKYQYAVTGGRIVGEGARVTWHLTGLDPGSYEVNVQVNDQHGGMASRATRISVLELGHCPLPCATVIVSCPDDVEQGRPITFKGSVGGGEPDVNPTYKWTVSTGTIINGQGTASIQLDTTNLAEQEVTATLEVCGYPPECVSTASCRVRVRKKQ